MNLDEFLHMGGYGFYVWSAYAIVFVLLILNVILPIVHRRQILTKIARRHQRERRLQT